MEEEMSLDDEVRILDALIARERVDGLERPGLIARLTESPDGDTWRTFVHHFGLALGTASIVSGVVYLVAFNWEDLGFVPKLILALALPVVCAALGARQGPRSMGGTLATTAGAATVGAPLVVYSQHWQSGADPWQLFAIWCALATPFALASRAPGTWAVWIALLDATVLIAARDLLDDNGAWLITGMALAHLAASQLFAGRWLDHVLRLLAVGSLFQLAAFWAIDDRGLGHGLFAAWLVLAVGCVVVQGAYAFGKVRGPAAALWLTAGVGVGFVHWAKLLIDADVSLAGGLLLSGFVLLVAVAGSFAWLVGVPRLRPSGGDA